MTDSQGHARPSRARSRPMRGLVLVAAPLLFFMAIEVVLAIIGFGGREPLFIPSADLPGMREPNSKVIQRYFPGRQTKLGIDPIPFKIEKPGGSIRIVVQGGSTAAGFPYGRWAGLAGMLGDRLEAVHPEREIELVSTAMAAVNSYTLLDFVDEIIEIEPDMVLIYVGHNEYLGIFGAGSALTAERSRSATLLHLRLGQFRVYQLMHLLLSVLRSSDDVPGAAGDTLMSHAASSAEIPQNSKTFRDGLLQFESNLRVILEKYQRAGIPVLVGTLVSNERNQPPFAGGVSQEVDSAVTRALFRRAHERRAASDWTGARELLESILALDPAAADAWFKLGQVEQAAGDADAAREAFRKAKDLDRLRFRAPEEFNQLIRQLAGEFQATVVEVQAHFAERAPLGIVGKELMLEHLHPNAEGYFTLADAYFEVLERSGRFGPPSVSVTRSEAKRDMPITAVDRLLAAQAIREIRSEFPFRLEQVDVPYPPPRNPVQEIAKQLYDDPTVWLGAMEGLLQHYLTIGRLRDAAVVARITAQALPGESAPNFSAASLMLKLGQYRRAKKYLFRSFEAAPRDPATLQLLIRTHLRLEEEEGARSMLARLEQLDPEHPAVVDFERWRVRDDPHDDRQEGPSTSPR